MSAAALAVESSRLPPPAADAKDAAQAAGEPEHPTEGKADEPTDETTSAATAPVSHPASVPKASGAVASSAVDSRPLEEIVLRDKHVHMLTDEDVSAMMHPMDSTTDSAAAAASTSASVPARIASLQLVRNRCIMLPRSLSLLAELNQLRLIANEMDLFDDEDMEPREKEEEREEHAQSESDLAQPPDAEGVDAALAPPKTTLSRSLSSNDPQPPPPSSLARSASSGLRGLRQLEHLELVRRPCRPLSASALPPALLSLSVAHFALSSRFFLGDPTILASLHTLTLNNIQSLDDSLLGQLPVLRKLQSLSITNHRSVTQLPPSLSDMLQLTSLNLRQNQLIAMPESLHKLQALKFLDCTQNQIIQKPRVFATLQERGCQVKHDLTMEESSAAEGELLVSTVNIEDMPDDEPSQSVAAASSSSSSAAATAAAASAASSASAAAPGPHSTKRKKDPAEESDEEDHQQGKHARSSNQDEPDSSSAAAASSPPSVESDLSLAAAQVQRATAQSGTAAAARSKRKLASHALLDDAPNKKHAADPIMLLAFKYLNLGELDYTDRLVSGWFDCGRKSTWFADPDRALRMTLDDVFAMPLLDAESRECILIDEHRDGRLKQIYKQARLMIKQTQAQSTDTSASSAASTALSSDALHMQVKLLACLVSDSFGGRVVVFNDQAQPSPSSPAAAAAPSFLSPLAHLYALCHEEVKWWKHSSASNLVLLTSIQHGLCRHRSILMKYLCDRLFDPRDVQCKLVRGFREGGAGHAWNQIRIRANSPAAAGAAAGDAHRYLEHIVDTLDSPHLFRPLSSLSDPSFAYYPQMALASSSSFAGADSAATIGTLRDLHLVRKGALLGRGAYSEVFECILPDSAHFSQHVALKVTQIAHLTPVQFASLLKEIRILPHLRHHNIVPFLAYVISNTELRVFMDQVRGCNLDVLLKLLRAAGRRLSVADIVVLAGEIAQGLQYLHSQSTLHRDLKSAQVLLGHPQLDADKTQRNFQWKPSVAAAAASSAFPERKIIKVKKKTPAAHVEEPAAAAAASSSSGTAAQHSPAASSPSSGGDILPALVPVSSSCLSFFSSARVCLCDFNIAIAILSPPATGVDDDDGDEASGSPSSSSFQPPPVEYVGTLRWAAPEVFRESSVAKQAAMSSPSSSTSSASNPAGAAAAAASPSASGASASSSSSLSGSPPMSPSARLRHGQQSDVWSYSMLLLEMLTLHLPYEDVASEPELNERLIRGERSSCAQWLDPQYVPDHDTERVDTIQQRATDAWTKFEQEAAAPLDATTKADTELDATFHSRAYLALVGLYLAGTEADAAKRPTMTTICRTLAFIQETLSRHKTHSKPDLV